ncbi:TPA: hypothetical protein QCN90_005116 [Bacillus pacificus]|uniref:hypothetical protein n=1 Tax=Bacillus cereus group TaxID=86661 RepID=UPI000807640D|nr:MULTISPECIES: hypothetical protein [Bacillus cereus group]OBZ59141.1 hypothetical protein UN66_09305 [Bacillus cereus]MCX3302845.1 hypothetical protein [Bacillus pacificus]MCX3329381.1 hypothetical protein [Bacillus pacificus]MDA2035467.1 hypothetical protein [Bacillus cereus group sp. Bcc02]OJE19711.1 hypothetical protein BAQ45_17240 [Bacillus pacificus]
MKKKQISIAEEFSKIGEKLAEDFAKGIEEARNKKSSLDNIFAEIKNDQMKQAHESYKKVGEMLLTMKEGLVAAGFTEEQAMSIVIEEYLQIRAEAKELM